MTVSFIAPQIESECAADLYARDVVRHRAVLNALIDIGADMARLVHQRAKTEADAAPPGLDESRPAIAELAAAFDQIARAVRRSVILARRLGEPIVAADPARPRILARQQIIRAAEDAIERNAADHEAAGLHAELRERLDSPDLDDDIADRPVADIIAEICRDLGLAAAPGTRPWKRRTPADLVVIRASAAAVPRPGRAAMQACAAGPLHAPCCRDP